MSKALVWFLIGFGFFLLIVGALFGKTAIWLIGLVIASLFIAPWLAFLLVIVGIPITIRIINWER